MSISLTQSPLLCRSPKLCDKLHIRQADPLELLLSKLNFSSRLLTFLSPTSDVECTKPARTVEWLEDLIAETYSALMEMQDSDPKSAFASATRVADLVTIPRLPEFLCGFHFEKNQARRLLRHLTYFITYQLCRWSCLPKVRPQATC